jgi:hypothetical protein
VVADERGERRLVAEQLRVEVEAVRLGATAARGSRRSGQLRRVDPLTGQPGRDEDAVEPARAPLPVADDVDEVAHGEHRPVAAHHPVLEHVVAGAERGELVANASPVARMDRPLPEAGLLEPAGERIVQELLRVPTDEGQLQRRRVGLPHDGSQPLEERAEALTRLVG